MKVKVNGQNMLLAVSSLAYSDLVVLAGYRSSRRDLTVTYHRSKGAGGSLLPGQTIKPLAGMSFDVVFTGAA